MPRTFLSFLTLLLLSVFFGPPLRSTQAAEPFALNPGDHLCLIGNTLAERMQHHGWLEARLQSRFPNHNLVIRNLGFSGDELTTRLRSAGFGTPDEHLTFNKADVVFAFFGYNESYGGSEGLDKFKTELADFLKHTLSQKYNGKSAPRVVLFSPIAHEDIRDRNHPDGKANNERLAVYTDAMKAIAAAHNVVFVDLFQPTQALWAQSPRPLTINGVHLSEAGDKALAPIVERGLFGDAPDRDGARLETIRGAVLEKNFFWFNRYRTVDGYSIYGGRADLAFVAGQTNREVMQRELQVLDVMTANRDKVIWAAAQGKPLPKPDDSNTPAFIPVKTNKPGPGPNGEHTFLTGAESLTKLQAGPGLKVNLFASEERFPDLANPVQVAFDPKGRLWVACMPSYPHWKPKEEMNDKIIILEDTDGDGKADVCKTFADKLHVPTGLEFYNGGLLVGQQPDLMYLKDTNGDDVADVRERVLHGVDSADTHHALNSFTLSPGGALHFQEGTFHHTQVETPYGPPERSANAAVFRYEPRTSKFQVYVAYSFANPHGHVFDRWGQDFVTDGTGNVNYYATAFSGYMDFPNKHAGMQPFFQQRIRPCPGTEIISSRHFPDDWQGDYLDANVIGFQGILRYKVQDADSGFKGVEADPLVFSSDPNFRPTDMEMGPDGALYFTDWQNPIIGHMQHNLRDPSRDRAHGRVYRVTHESRPLVKPAKIAGEPIPVLLDLLKEHEDRVRSRVKIELGGRDSIQVVDGVVKWIETLDKNDPEFEHHMMEALWVCEYHNVVKEDLLKRMLRSSDFRARAAATRVLCYWRDRVADPLALLQVQVEDSYPRVRLEAVRACSFFREARAAEIALLALKKPMDYYLNYTLNETMKQLQPYWRKAVAEGKPFAADNPAGIDYLLAAVSTAELIKLPRTALVHQALLSRADIVHDLRHEALMGLAKLNKTTMMAELLAAVERLDASDAGSSDNVLHDLAHMMTETAPRDLKGVRDQVAKLAAAARKPFTRQIAYVTLMTADQSIDAAWGQAAKSAPTLRDWLEAVPLIPDKALRASAHDRVKPLVAGLPPSLAPLAKVGGGAGRFVRIELPRRRQTLTLAEVQVFSDGVNIAPRGKATQSATSHGGEASRAIDGNASGVYADGGQTHTPENGNQPWWELDLQAERSLDSIVVWNRTEGALSRRLNGFTITVLDSSRRPIFRKTDNPAPSPNVRFELGGDPAGSIRRAAMTAIVATGREEDQTFVLLANLVRDNDQRAAALKAISRLPKSGWSHDRIPSLIDSIVAFVGKTPVKDRTSPESRDALQLGDELAARLPAKQAQSYRKALRELGVPVIVVRPVPHLMIYDKSRIFVEAGKPVEIVFENVDIMAHNLLVGRPGTLERIGIEGEKMAADPNAFAKNFVPNVPDVLYATKLLQPQQTDRITFNAPSELGEYPYVCTFPGHWRRMNGVMQVVSSLDDVPREALAAAEAPTAAAARPFVKAWKVADLADSLKHLEHGRDPSKGKALFATLSCVQCHRMKGVGGQAGPDLVSVKEKLTAGKMTTRDVLTEMIEPSKIVDEKYRSVVFELNDGKVISGIVASREGKRLNVVSNPLDPKGAQEPVAIQADDIAEQFPSKVSLMPEGLLNTLTQDEILDLMSYVFSGGD